MYTCTESTAAELFAVRTDNSCVYVADLGGYAKYSCSADAVSAALCVDSSCLFGCIDQVSVPVEECMGGVKAFCTNAGGTSQPCCYEDTATNTQTALTCPSFFDACPNCKANSAPYCTCSDGTCPLETWKVAVVAVGSVVVLLCCIGVVSCMCRRHRNNSGTTVIVQSGGSAAAASSSSTTMINMTQPSEWASNKLGSPSSQSVGAPHQSWSQGQAQWGPPPHQQRGPPPQQQWGAPQYNYDASWPQPEPW